ncbi:Metallo-dependent phosphatase-like protein [Aspergillus avenaceus]|uniref:Endopolyphosphatase n=1 Tax=Aspergillus avenaceus TaxID=36643 RepID=A0A5N6TG22_ASPAV|nr:Metallo-dependent phosphatase-like protein [Aspergillus avenaceus]
MLLSCFFLIIGALIGTVSAIPDFLQQPLVEKLWPSFEDPSSTDSNAGSSSTPALTGRFLHITDLHPDPHYKARSSTDEDDACHRGKGSAGYFGAEGSECDAPFTLINETFRWIEKHLKGNIDFVIWTGDSARHDNDEKAPRTEDEVSDLNKIIADKFFDTFKEGSAKVPSIPIVPTFGNNDIMPHNIFKNGPNRWTKRFLDIWAKFIPEYQRHSFVEGGWFTSEVIPNRLAVISLNTMYFFDSNSAVDGCSCKSQPGYEHMEWLRVQLKLLRSRNMKAILIGHVPPARSGSKRSWDETCWQKYTLWVHQYRDVIAGTAYGHMNIDHFMLQDSHKINILGPMAALGDTSDKVSVQSRSGYLASLREDWSKLPSPPQITWDALEKLSKENSCETPTTDPNLMKSKKKKRKFLKKIGGPWAERYSVSLVSPSLVPNYFPSLRVIEYNISGMADAATWADVRDQSIALDGSSSEIIEGDLSLGKKGKKKKKLPHHKVPDPPSSTAPPGPAYSNQPLTWLGYTQYFANLTRINDEMSHYHEAELDGATKMNNNDIFSFEVEYDTRNDHIYKMEDLTVRSFFKLASRIAKGYATAADISPCEMNNNDLRSEETGIDNNDNDINLQKKKKHKKKKEKNKVWRAFLERAFVGFLDDDDINDF